MKKTKILAGVLGSLGIVSLAVFLTAADHVDAPAVIGTTSDIADFYAFEGDNPNKTVFIATLQGPLSPGPVTENAVFDEDVMVEINIDNTGDFIEDLVIQAIKRNDSMIFFGPVAPLQTGIDSQVETSGTRSAVKLTVVADTEPIVASNDGMRFFAGPRRDGFFFDFNRFNQVASGSVAPEGFLPPGTASDFFVNLNVLAIAVEVPNSMLGTAPVHAANGVGGVSGLPNAYNVWVTTKRKL